MNHTKNHSLINHNATHKCLALIIGILLWQMVSVFHNTSITLSLPIYLFNKEENRTYTAPEKVEVTISGTKNDLKTIDFSSLAIHLDAKKYADVYKNIIIVPRHLLLPPKIRITRVQPSNIVITTKKKSA